MTGESAHSRLVPAIEWAMSPAERTLADEFNTAGYDTIYIGKWHLDGGHGRMGNARQCGLTPVRRVNQGRWRKWFGFELRNDPFDTYYFIDDNPVSHKIDGYQTDKLFDIGMDYLANDWDKSKSFCMCISVEPPHDPFVAPEDLQREWEAKDIKLPYNFTPGNDEERERLISEVKCYYAMVENLDNNVGKMTAFLEEHNLLENTVILFFSDHGELNGSHGLRSKQWPYEESVGIPLIIRDPRNKAMNGTVLKAPTNTEDLFPTILGLAGLKPQNQVSGINLTPLIHGEISCLDRESVMLEFVAEHRPEYAFNNEVWRGIRSENFKYTVKGDKLGGKPWQFFDLENDPGEMNNLLDDPQYKDEILHHHKQLCQKLAETDDPFVLLPAFGCAGINMWE
jgi:arylsulfatase A-like enzyme